MQPRQLLIVVVAGLVVFGAAFGIAKAGAGDEPKASAGVEPAEVIEVGDATVSARVADAGRLPALQLPERTPEATENDPPASTTGPVATSTPATSTPPPTTTTAPSSSSGGTTQPQASDPAISGGGD